MPNEAASFTFGSASGCIRNKNIFQRMVTHQGRTTHSSRWSMPVFKSSSTIKTLVCHWGKCIDKFFHTHCMQTRRHEVCLGLALLWSTNSRWLRLRQRTRQPEAVQFNLVWFGSLSTLPCWGGLVRIWFGLGLLLPLVDSRLNECSVNSVCEIQAEIWAIL